MKGLKLWQKLTAVALPTVLLTVPVAGQDPPPDIPDDG